MNSFQHPYCPVLFTMFAFTPGAVLRQFPAPSSKCTTLCTPASGPKLTTSLRIVGETDFLLFGLFRASLLSYLLSYPKNLRRAL